MEVEEKERKCKIKKRKEKKRKKKEEVKLGETSRKENNMTKWLISKQRN